MQFAIHQKAFALGLTASAFALGSVFAGCGGSSSSNNNGNNGGSGSSSGAGASSGSTAASGGGVASGSASGDTSDLDAGSSVSTVPGSCASPSLKIDFSPMYSAFIPGSMDHVFAIPAIMDDGNLATWSLSDPTQAKVVPQTFNGIPGVMITVQGTGDSSGNITVFASEAGGACASSVLHITTNTENDWTTGSARYNDGVTLTFNTGGRNPFADGGNPFADGGNPFADGGNPFAGGGMGGTTSDASIYERDGGTACTNCHGPTATSSRYRTVSHTPEQTGGFSDTDLANIILHGQIPDGGYFDPSVINASCDGGTACTALAMSTWQSFHQWDDITSDELPGIICYLRSLTPSPQTGTPAFGNGGRNRGDGGARPMFDGGRGMGMGMGPGTDSGMGMGADTGTGTEADTGTGTQADTGTGTEADSSATLDTGTASPDTGTTVAIDAGAQSDAGSDATTP